jgi:hypothetical protein
MSEEIPSSYTSASGGADSGLPSAGALHAGAWPAMYDIDTLIIICMLIGFAAGALTGFAYGYIKCAKEHGIPLD